MGHEVLVEGSVLFFFQRSHFVFTFHNAFEPYLHYLSLLYRVFHFHHVRNVI